MNNINNPIPPDTSSEKTVESRDIDNEISALLYEISSLDSKWSRLRVALYLNIYPTIFNPGNFRKRTEMKQEIICGLKKLIAEIKEGHVHVENVIRDKQPLLSIAREIQKISGFARCGQVAELIGMERSSFHNIIYGITHDTDGAVARSLEEIRNKLLRELEKIGESVPINTIHRKKLPEIGIVSPGFIYNDGQKLNRLFRGIADYFGIDVKTVKHLTAEAMGYTSVTSIEKMCSGSIELITGEELDIIWNMLETLEAIGYKPAKDPYILADKQEIEEMLSYLKGQKGSPQKIDSHCSINSKRFFYSADGDELYPGYWRIRQSGYQTLKQMCQSVKAGKADPHLYKRIPEHLEEVNREEVERIIDTFGAFGISIVKLTVYLDLNYVILRDFLDEKHQAAGRNTLPIGMLDKLRKTLSQVQSRQITPGNIKRAKPAIAEKTKKAKEKLGLVSMEELWKYMTRKCAGFDKLCPSLNGFLNILGGRKQVPEDLEHFLSLAEKSGVI